MALATRLALFHRILSTTRSADAQVKDMDTWITEQVARRSFPDRHTLEAALTSHVQILVGALTVLADGIPQPQPFSGGQDQEIIIYNSIQQTVDSILESAQWLCGPEFEMSISRICPQWPAHEKSIEQFVHYVQVVESMKETVSGRFQHPQELSEDLARCQEMIDYQRTLFGETLRNHGLEWRALGFPPMEGLVQQTQDWVLNMARTLTVKIKAEINLMLEQNQASGQPGMDLDEVAMSRAVMDVMELVLQGALFTGSCLEFIGKRCPMLVTAWTELASQYCYLTLAKRKEQAFLASRPRGAKATRSSPFLPSSESRKHALSGMSRGLLLRTMELFENVSRLLQCLMEMHEEEALGHSPSLTDESLGGDDEDQNTILGASAASSDQDEAMDIITSTSSSSSFHSQGMQEDIPPSTFGNHYQQPQCRMAATRPRRARQSMDPATLQRWIAMESLASILVEIGLELCGSMAETLGSSDTSVRSLKSSLGGFNPTLPATIPMLHPQQEQLQRLQLQESLNPKSRFGVLGSSVNSGIGSRNFSTTGHHYTHQPMSSAARAAAAISSLTSFAGGNAMALGTGGIGLIYVQFVARLISKIIEFAGQDSHQEQRLLRVHSSLQNLEFALTAT
ncbi:hypothetical protein BGZ81_005418 [Podila clonocystis]|nr:hypothetical protein BGZ81_005418 [Podila clonocystis]